MRGLTTPPQGPGFEHPLVDDDEYNRQRSRVAVNKITTLAFDRSQQCEASRVSEKVRKYGLIGLTHKPDVENYSACLRLQLSTYADPAQIHR